MYHCFPFICRCTGSWFPSSRWGLAPHPDELPRNCSVLCPLACAELFYDYSSERARERALLLLLLHGWYTCSAVCCPCSAGAVERGVLGGREKHPVACGRWQSATDVNKKKTPKKTTTTTAPCTTQNYFTSGDTRTAVAPAGAYRTPAEHEVYTL